MTTEPTLRERALTAARAERETRQRRLTADLRPDQPAKEQPKPKEEA